jgi:Protein of unknown function (DUF3631)
MSDVSEKDLRQIVLLYEVVNRGAQDDADVHVKNEAVNATLALLRLLGKYGLSIGDVPALQARQAQAEAAKDAKAASAAAAPGKTPDNQPNVLDLMRHMFQGYSDVQPHEYIGITLWVAYSHVFGRFQISPRLALLSPVRGCGKSNTLSLIEKLALNATKHDHISAPALFRLIEQGAGTMLLDEGDNLGLKIDRVMRSVLNSGHLRGGGITRVIRGQPTTFSTFAPAAIAAIGTLTLPLLHRSIVIQVHRSLRTDLKTIEEMNSIEELRRLEALRRHIVAWGQTAQFDLNPQLPRALRGRGADNWRVLISIADSFDSKYWSTAAREAAIVFVGGCHDEDACVALLHDIRATFFRLNVDRIKSSVLVAMLNEMEDGAGVWNAWRGENDDQSPHAISQGEVASLLRRFSRDLRPRTVFELGPRGGRGASGRGYHRQQFEQWWERYCPEDNEDANADNVRQLRPAE